MAGKEYFYDYGGGKTGTSMFQRDAQGNVIRDAQGNAAPGKLLGRSDGQGGYTLNSVASAPMAAAPAPGAAPAPQAGTQTVQSKPLPVGSPGGPSWGGGTGAASPSPAPGTGGGSSSSSSSGLIAGNIAPAPLASPTQWNVTGNQTVAGQIKSLTDPNSALAQQFQTAGVKQAASRGLLNSSMAATAGYDSLLRGITPIATSDAETYAKAAGYNADQANQANQLQYTQGNQWAINQANNANSLEQQRLQNAGSMAQAQLSAETQKYLAGINNASAQAVAKLNNEAQAAMNAEKQKHDAILQTSSAAANAYQQYANAMLNIQIQPSMNEEAKRTAIANAQAAYQFAMEAAYKLSSAQLPDFSQQLDFSQPEPEPDAAAPARETAPWTPGPGDSP